MVRMPLSRLSGWRGWSRNEGGGQVQGHGHQVGTQGGSQRAGCREAEEVSSTSRASGD